MCSPVLRNFPLCLLAAVALAPMTIAAAVAKTAPAGLADPRDATDSTGTATGGRAEWPSPAAVENAAQSRGPQTPAAEWQPGDPGVLSVPAKLFRHADRVIARFDKDASGQLEQSEWAEAAAALSLDLERLDADGDGVIVALEVAEYIAAFGRHRLLEPVVRTRQAVPDFLPLLKPSTPGLPAEGSHAPRSAEESPPAESTRPVVESAGPTGWQPAKKFHVSPSRLPAGLPAWFISRDGDGDGQLDFAEFAPQGGQWAMEQFRRYDANEDGLITPAEVLRAGQHSAASAKSQGP